MIQNWIQMKGTDADKVYFLILTENKELKQFGSHLLKHNVILLHVDLKKLKQTLSKHGKLYLQELCMSPMRITITQIIVACQM